MINKKELCLFNTILDKGDFWGIPGLQNIKISPLLSEPIYESLIRKGYLSDKKHFTSEGAKLLKCISEYKSAKRYVRIGSVIFAVYNSDYAISLIQNPICEEYDFIRVSSHIDIVFLEEEFAFLQHETSKEIVNAQSITFEELEERLALRHDNSVFISSFDVEEARKDINKAIRNEVFFWDNGQFYCFNRDENMLYCCNKEDIFSKITERMVI